MSSSLIRDAELINHLKEQHSDANTNEFSVLDFASAFGNPLEALVYKKLFWPDFIELKGMIFHPSVMESEDDIARALRCLSEGQSSGNIERSVNYFEVPESFFSGKAGVTTDQENIRLAVEMKEMWEARLAMLFPHRKAVVELLLEEDESPSLTVFQKD